MVTRIYMFLLFLSLSACQTADGTESVDVAKMCVNQELGMICPLGTSPNLAASASSSCDQETSFEAEGSATSQEGSGAGALDSVCVAAGDCFIKCDVVVECEYGYEVFTREQISCKSAPE